MKHVVVIQRIIAPYRVPFYEKAKKILKKNNIKLTVIYGQPSRQEKEPYFDLKFGIKVKAHYFYIGKKFLVWIPFFKHIKHADLIIVPQSNKNLINYFIITFRHLFNCKVALWGHGKNLQSNKNSLSERFKSIYSKHVDFWFAYNTLSAEIVKKTGYPHEKITSINNSIDTRNTTQIYDTISSKEINCTRIKFGLKLDTPVGIFCSRLYSLKRLPFLLSSLKAIRKKIPNFHFILIGDGVEVDIIRDFTKRHENWFHWVGAKFGREKACLFQLAQFQLMPGAVGLNIVESFALLTPIVTTDIGFHGPEIHYLDNRRNGLITKNNKDEYVQAVVNLIQDTCLQNRLVEGCREARKRYTIENMVEKFSKGIYRSLSL